jgi:hypothetical protein
MSGSATTEKIFVPAKRPKVFFINASSMPEADFAPGVVAAGAATGAGMRFIRLDENMLVTRAYDNLTGPPTALTTPSSAALLAEARRLGNVPWINNPVAFSASDPSHPSSLDPGRVSLKSGMLPDGPTSLSPAIETHAFFSPWLTTHDLANPPGSVAERLHAPITAPFVPSVITSGPFVFHLEPGPSGDACMLLRVTIECEAPADLCETDSSTALRYAGGAPNGVTFVANNDNPWVFSETHAMGFVMTSAGGGDIGHRDRFVYVNKGLMSVVYEGDDGGIVNDIDVPNKYPAAMTAKVAAEPGGEGAFARKMVLSNHGGLGSIGASTVRRFQRVWTKLIDTPHALGTYMETTIVQDTTSPAPTGQLRIGTPITTTFTSTATINDFLRFPSAAVATKDGLPLVCFAYIDSPLAGGAVFRDTPTSLSKDYLRAESRYGQSHYEAITDTTGTRIVNGVRVFDLFTPSAYETSITTGTGDWGPATLGYTARGEALGPQIDIATDRCFFFAYESEIASAATTPALNAIRPVFFVHIVYSPFEKGHDSNPDNHVASAATATHCVLEVRTGSFWTSNVTGEVFDALRPLQPFISPVPVNHDDQLVHSTDPRQYVIGYPLGYHGSTLRGALIEGRRRVVSVAGVKRVAVSTTQTRSREAAVVNFMLIRNELVELDPKSATRSTSRAPLAADYVFRPQSIEPLMWEPATLADKPPEFATLARPDGFVIRTLRDYVRTVPLAPEVLTTNPYAIPGVVTDADVDEIVAHLVVFASPASDAAKRLWAGEEVMPAASGRSLVRIRGTLIGWGREMFRYAKMIEMVARGDQAFLAERSEASLTASELATRTARVTAVKDACVKMWTGIRTVLATGIMPRYGPHQETLGSVSIHDGSSPAAVSKLNVVYRRGTAGAAHTDHNFIEEMANWVRLRYDRTMCEDPRGVRPVWGGVTTRVDHELRQWAVIVDPTTGAPDLDLTKNFSATKLIPVVQLANLAPVAEDDIATTHDFAFESDNNFSYYSHHHVVYGYLLYAAAVCLRYAADQQGQFGSNVKSIARDCSQLLTGAEPIACGGSEPFPLLQLLHDFLSPMSELDLNTAGGSAATGQSQRSRIRSALADGASAAQLAALAIPDPLPRGVRAMSGGDTIRRAFPPMRAFDIHAGHSWGPGPEPFFRASSQESSTESALAYYAAYHFLVEARAKLSQFPIARGALTGPFLMSDNALASTGGAQQILPWNAVVALAHEIATAKIYRSTKLNNLATMNARRDTFGSPTAIVSLATYGAGHPITLSALVVTSMLTGFLTQTQTTGVARETRHTFQQEAFRLMPAKMVLHVGAQSVPLVPGVSTPMFHGINDPQWLRLIADITNIGDMLLPFVADPADPTRPAKWALDRRPKVATIGQWLDFILLHAGDPAPGVGTETDPQRRARMVQLPVSASGPGLFQAAPDVKQWARMIAAALLHRVRPLPLNSAATATTQTWQAPDPTAIPYPKALDAYLPQSSYWDVVTWFRANAGKISRAAGAGGSAAPDDTATPHFSTTAEIPPLPATTVSLS